MSISTCEPGSVLQRLGTLISHMPSSILNSLNIYGSLLQWAWCRAQTKSKCVPLTHFWKSLRESSKPSICLCLFKTRREWSIQYYRSHLCPQGYFLDKSPKDKVEEWLYWIRADTHSSSCQEWRHQYYMLLFHEHTILDSYHLHFYQSGIRKDFF